MKIVRALCYNNQLIFDLNFLIYLYFWPVTINSWDENKFHTSLGKPKQIDDAVKTLAGITRTRPDSRNYYWFSWII